MILLKVANTKSVLFRFAETLHKILEGLPGSACISTIFYSLLFDLTNNRTLKLLS